MNKIGFKKRTVCAVLVSVICILLASSFIFHTVAEASVLTYSLQGASFGNYINDDGTISSNGLDRSLIDNYSVTAQNQYSITNEYSNAYYYTFGSGNYYSYYGIDNCLGVRVSGTTAYFFIDGVAEEKTVVSATEYWFCKDFYYAGTKSGVQALYDYSGNVLVNFDSDYDATVFALYPTDDFIFVGIVIKTSSSGYTYNGVYLYNYDFQLVKTVSTSVRTSGYFCSCVFGDYIIYNSRDGALRFSISSLVVSSFPVSTSYYAFGSDGVYFYSFRPFSPSFVEFFSIDGTLVGSYYSDNFTLGLNNTNVRNLPFILDSFVMFGENSSIFRASKPNQYYTDFTAQFVDSFTPLKWINFSCRPSTDGSVVGGNALSIKLDYALSDDYLATVNTYGVKVSGCTMLASLDDLSTGTGYYGLPPLVVKVNGSVVPRITKQYESVEKVGDVYLYAFSAFCDFQGSTKINSLEIYMNCFVPEQLSRHSFSLPVSDVELYLEPVGGGGGESSGGGSSGGESSGTPSVDPGESSDDVPGENDPAFLKIYKVSSGGTLSYIRYFPTAQLSKVSVFFGSLPSFEYSRQGTYGISPSSSFLVLEYVDSGQRIIDLDFYAQGWSKTPSLSSMHYPLFTGNVIEIDFSNTYSIYLADVVPYGQIRICDYDNTTYSLVNLPAPDSVVNISQYSDTQFQVSCQGSVRYYSGKIARYKEYGFGSSTPWQLYEEGAVLQFSRLGSPLLNTVQLQTYTGEFPPHDPDYEEQIRIEESIRAELESRANEIYGSVSFDPQDESDFDEAKQDVTDVLGSGSVFFNFVNKLWNTNPFTSHFVVITATCAILAFVLRKL